MTNREKNVTMEGVIGQDKPVSDPYAKQIAKDIIAGRRDRGQGAPDALQPGDEGVAGRRRRCATCSSRARSAPSRPTTSRRPFRSSNRPRGPGIASVFLLFPADRINIRPLSLGNPDRRPAARPAAGAKSRIAVRPRATAGPRATYLTEQSSVWRQHAEDDPFGRTGRGPARCRVRGGRPAGGARADAPRRATAAAPAEPAAAPRRAARRRRRRRRPKSSTTRTASKRCWKGGDIVAKVTLAILVIMSMGSWYIIITKVYEQAKMGKQARAAEKTFWSAPSVQEGADGLEEDRARSGSSPRPGIEATSKHVGLLEQGRHERVDHDVDPARHRQRAKPHAGRPRLPGHRRLDGAVRRAVRHGLGHLSTR